ncbi:MAG: replicative DNA helicase, partial [Pseudomonadota bacterium]
SELVGLVDGECIAGEHEDFFHPQYAIIFDAIKSLATGNRPIDYVTVCGMLSDRGKLESVGGQTAILEIVEDQASSANIYHYAKIVKDKSSVRNIVRIANRVVERGLTFGGDIDEFVSEVEASFFKLTSAARFGGLEHLSFGLKNNLKELESTGRRPGEIAGMTTGYPKLDELLLGMQPGQLIIIAARPAMGKTSLGLNFAVRACETSGLPVAVFSLEMLTQELSMRLLCSKAKVDSRRIRTKDFRDTDLRSIGIAVQQLSTLPIYINESGSVTILDIQSQCRKIKAEQGLGMIIIDYLQLMRSHTNNPSREQQIAEMSRGLKSMAKELECPVICLSQLNRAVEARPNKRPNLSDLRESGSIEQDADVVLMVYRDEFYHPDTKEKGIAEIIVSKNRSGETGTARLAWMGAYTSFENLAYDYPTQLT